MLMTIKDSFVLGMIMLLLGSSGISFKIEAQRQIGTTPSYYFRGGHIFNGEGFEEKDFYTYHGQISFHQREEIDSVIDIQGQYVIPPFGEAHNHNIEGEAHNDIAKQYIEDGIFYIKNPNNVPRSKASRGRIKMIGTVDAAWANGGITATDGHPSGLTKRNIEYGIFKKDEGDGGFIWIVDDLRDLNQKWEVLLSGKPDFIKTYLLYSEEYEIRKNDTSYYNRKGLNPEILAEVVKRAHHANLDVVTHIETIVDFRNAIKAGVDEINHMPGFRNLDKVPLDRFKITDEDAQLAAERGVTVVTTLMSDGDNKSVKALFRNNLIALKNARVRLALGSDYYRGNSRMEADYIHSLGVFSNVELLKIWCENTAQAVFSDRKIGKLKEGFEANFLILANNPLDEFRNTKKIIHRVKQGYFINIPEE